MLYSPAPLPPNNPKPPLPLSAFSSLWYFGTEEGSRNVEFAAADNMKRTWVNYGTPRNWEDNAQGQGVEFLRESVEVKNVWVPISRA